MSAISFGRREIRDLLAAWLALSVAFTLFLNPGLVAMRSAAWPPEGFVTILAVQLAVSLGTVGVAFVAHELAHKVVAVRFGQVAAFRADYGMLFLAVVSALAGFLFAAPGAVVHRGRITSREAGLIALAGPATNLAFAVGFLPVALLVDSAIGDVAAFGVTINLLLAGFNMLPVGPLDGKTVRHWDARIYVAVALPSILLAVAALFGPGL